MPDNLDDLRHIEGFPIGEDEDLLGLSDPPPYYCPRQRRAGSLRGAAGSSAAEG